MRKMSHMLGQALGTDVWQVLGLPQGRKKKSPCKSKLLRAMGSFAYSYALAQLLKDYRVSLPLEKGSSAHVRVGGAVLASGTSHPVRSGVAVNLSARICECT